MQTTFDKLGTSLDALGALSKAVKGGAMAVVITKDETKPAPGAHPATSGTSEPNASMDH